MHFMEKKNKKKKKNEKKHRHKLVVAGNHDGALAVLGKEHARRLLSSCTYLQDETVSWHDCSFFCLFLFLFLLSLLLFLTYLLLQVKIGGLRIHASPLSSGHSGNAAFQGQGGYDEVAAVEAIPPGLDVLITHGPAGSGKSALGRASQLLEERRRQACPRVHVFGHYHLGYGVRIEGCGALVNASSADALFAVTNPPVVIDIAPFCDR
ncbi:unnamed protein product [Polarella glacialis]|uniref:Uncharacterized protein n=1 Tax=Polarella glacialis TaxID=89957 RepID=A0A813DZ15_POLGL|nr:unnamed protein product [Polarella glacialis]